MIKNKLESLKGGHLTSSKIGSLNGGGPTPMKHIEVNWGGTRIVIDTTHSTETPGWQDIKVYTNYGIETVSAATITTDWHGSGSYDGVGKSF